MERKLFLKHKLFLSSLYSSGKNWIQYWQFSHCTDYFRQRFFFFFIFAKKGENYIKLF